MNRLWRVPALLLLLLLSFSSDMVNAFGVSRNTRVVYSSATARSFSSSGSSSSSSSSSSSTRQRLRHMSTKKTIIMAHPFESSNNIINLLSDETTTTSITTASSSSWDSMMMATASFDSALDLSSTTTTTAAATTATTPLSPAMTVLIFLIGIFPFAVATVEFWRRIAVGEPFGTGSDQVVFPQQQQSSSSQQQQQQQRAVITIGEDNAPASSRGRRVLGQDSMIAAYILFTIAAGVLGISIYAILSSGEIPPPTMSLAVTAESLL